MRNTDASCIGCEMALQEDRSVHHSGHRASPRWAYGLPHDADWVTEADLPNASITKVEHWPLGRHQAGVPRRMLIRRIGDVAHLPPELVTDI